MNKRFKNRLLRILGEIPGLLEILNSSAEITDKRIAINKLLSGLGARTLDGGLDTPPLLAVLVNDAIRTFRNLMSRRSARVAGFDFLKYIDDLIHKADWQNLDKPTPDFFAELENLVRGITGHADVYPEKAPFFTKHTGAKAARLRSADLSRMARVAQKYLDRYPTGLKADVERIRSFNRARILKHFGGTDYDWWQWKWQARHIIRDLDTLRSLIELTDEESEAVRLAREYRIPFGITPYYLSLMDYKSGGGRDRAIRAQVIPSLHYIRTLKKFKDGSATSMDFMLERDTSPEEGITRRYPMICILKPILTCPQICVYCQRNWEIEDVYSPKAALGKEKLERAINWIAETTELREVLITGGDPLLLSNRKIENLLYRLSRIPHIKRIRIGTRTPVTMPMRINDSLVKDIVHFHHPGKREILIITHFEHPYEISRASRDAVQKFRRFGMEVYNQLVFTYYNSRKFEAAFLRDQLRLIGVTPYYTFNTKGKEETDDFRVPIPRLLQEQKEEARLFPGTVRTDEIVFNVPRLGKNYLRATQHHDVISILPDGRRVYEFHPWEKKLALADTYVYTDVSIYRFLQRLKADGENVSDYKTIWYYY